MALQVLAAPDGWLVPASLFGDPARGYESDEDRLKATINAHILIMTLVTGWGEITEDNYRDWWRRARAYEVASEVTLMQASDGERVPMPLTLDMVRERIGLRVNVGRGNGRPERTDAQFKRRLADLVMERVERELRAAQANAAREARAEAAEATRGA